MRTFLITTLLVSLAYAKPEYSYPAPSQQPSGLYGRPNVAFSASPFSGNEVFNSNLAEKAAQVRAQAGGASSQSGYNFDAGSSFGTGSGGSVGGSFGSSGSTLVQKHIYVHVAPPEPEEFRPQQQVAAGQATKHYKIIFIKAPSYQTYQQQILQAQAQNEEKTLVYVLVKKPDDVADITLPTAAPTAPSKPEVYFIRYKAKSEVSGGGGGAGAQYAGGSGAALEGGASQSFGSSSSSSSQFNLNAESLSLSSLGGGQPTSVYGPPGKSGPY